MFKKIYALGGSSSEAALHQVPSVGRGNQ